MHSNDSSRGAMSSAWRNLTPRAIWANYAVACALGTRCSSARATRCCRSPRSHNSMVRCHTERSRGGQHVHVSPTAGPRATAACLATRRACLRCNARPRLRSTRLRWPPTSLGCLYYTGKRASKTFPNTIYVYKTRIIGFSEIVMCDRAQSLVTAAGRKKRGPRNEVRNSSEFAM